MPLGAWDFAVQPLLTNTLPESTFCKRILQQQK